MRVRPGKTGRSSSLLKLLQNRRIHDMMQSTLDEFQGTIERVQITERSQIFYFRKEKPGQKNNQLVTKGREKN